MRFIQIYHMGWSHHEGVSLQPPPQFRDTSQPSAALIQDLKHRGCRATLCLCVAESLAALSTVREIFPPKAMAGTIIRGIRASSFRTPIPVASRVAPGSVDRVPAGPAF